MNAHTLDGRVEIEHRDETFSLVRTSTRAWAITDATGTRIGHLTIVSPEGEEHEPVYGIHRDGDLSDHPQGSDWEGLVRALVNEVLDERGAP
ncbi:hypothetical protein [Compostimonas suwonensis]|uniref:Uncharacterized protein n=1 Tax=Compostimonas suwonensis TaxID=1048394 RepID=A0A2M9C3F6_9MICO|nr:hypothetical protein [Compostimonas suwonensis]PJJ65074.1 hypothetical protein CLV54_0101 [Compostimonas suwonensis]